MAEVAHRINALLLPERRSSYAHSSHVDSRFHTRLNSFLVSRHTRIPRAPCPSPDSSDAPGDVNVDEPGSSSTSAGARTFSVDGTIAKLAQPLSSELSLMASGFDGSASQHETPNLSYRRRLSQPEKGDESTVGGNETDVNDLKSNQSTYEKGPGEKRSAAGGAKRATSSRMPFFNLQTVPPASSGVLQKDPRAERLHIPGSYRSETETSSLHSFQRRSSSEGGGFVAEDLEPVSTHGSSTRNADFHSLAVGALNKAKGRDVAGTTPEPNLRPVKRASRETLMSTTSTQYGRHLLSKPAAGQSVAGKVAEPVVTSGVGHGQIYGEIKDTLSLLQDQQALESKKRSKSRSVVSSADDEAASTIDHPVSARSSRSQLSDLLGPPLPATKDLVDQPDEDPRTPEQVMIPQPLFSSNSLLHRRKSVAPTVVSKTSSADFHSIISRDVPNLSNAQNETVESGFATVEAVPRRSSTIYSPADKKSNNGPGDTTPLPNSYSLVGELADSTDANTHESSTKPADDEHPESKVHWIRQLLTSASSNSLLPHRQNTIASSSRRTSSATNRTAFQNTEPAGLSDSPKKPSRVSTGAVSNENPKEPQKQRSKEPFTRAIQELEGLLKDALVIAKQAADPSHSDTNLTSKGDSSNHEKVHSYEPPYVDSSHGSSVSGGSISSPSEATDEEAHYTTIPSVYIHNGEARSKRVPDIDASPSIKRSLSQALNQPLMVLPTESKSGVDEQPTQGNTLKSHQRLPQEIGGIGDDGPETANVHASHVIESAQLASPGMKANPVNAHDWALVTQPSRSQSLQPLESQTSIPMKSLPVPPSTLEKPDQRVHENMQASTTTSKPSMRLGANLNPGPVIQPRTSSINLRPQKPVEPPYPTRSPLDEGPAGLARKTDPRPAAVQPRKRPQPSAATRPTNMYTSRPKMESGYSFAPSIASTPEGMVLQAHALETPHEQRGQQAQDSLRRGYSLTGRRHVSLRGASGFSLARSHRRAPLARDWSPSRKRYVATVTCINTAVMGLIIGIYAGEVPAIQYAIVDEHHYTILGNVVFFLGLAITTILAWPLPLLHGRKPYVLAAFALTLPLQFPQALAVDKSRSPYVATYRVLLLVPRAFAGVIMGFANINFKTTLLDLFGASLQSSNPHQEVVNVNDVRRHGGGMGVWLGIWTWCSIGSIGVGFLIGAVIIGELDVAWGFWLSIILTASALVINVLVPEVRRSPYRRSMAEVSQGSDVSRRVARGEIKMHLDSTGPMWWGEELLAGLKLCVQMLKQPGFAVLALYVGWIYGQIIMVIVVSRNVGHLGVDLLMTN